MKKTIKIILLSAFMILTAINVCAVNLKYPLTTPQENYTPPALSEDGAWTMVIVPDTQAYIKKKQNHRICNTIFKWIADNVQALNIQMVLHTGDLVEFNDCKRTYPPVIDCDSEYQWQSISNCFKHLDNKVPYVLCTGNHDYGQVNSENRNTQLSKYFTPERNSKNKAALIEQNKNSFGRRTLENAAYEFTAPNGRKILIVSLEFSPTDEQIVWAEKIFSDPKYREHFGILLTHSYLYPLGHIFAEAPLNGNNGLLIFKKLVYPSENIKMVICGHFALPDNWLASTAFFKQKKKNGENVYEMLFDPQALGGGWHGDGGSGWIRLLEFSKDMKKLKVKTFSPHFASDKKTQNISYHTAAFNQFTVDIAE